MLLVSCLKSRHRYHKYCHLCPAESLCAFAPLSFILTAVSELLSVIISSRPCDAKVQFRVLLIHVRFRSGLPLQSVPFWIHSLSSFLKMFHLNFQTLSCRRTLTPWFSNLFHLVILPSGHASVIYSRIRKCGEPSECRCLRYCGSFLDCIRLRFNLLGR